MFSIYLFVLILFPVKKNANDLNKVERFNLMNEAFNKFSKNFLTPSDKRSTFL